MGAILARFRRKRTTYQILEQLEEDMKEAEALTISTKEKQRRFIVNLYLVSIGLFVIGCLVYYFYFLPPTWSKRIVYSTPLFTMLILVICLGRVGSWFFQKRLNKNLNKLSNLRAEKKKIIEKVMDTETYKVAIELLNRFGDKTNNLKPQTLTGATTNQSPVPYALNNKNLTQRLTISTPQPNVTKNQNLSITSASSFATPVSTHPNRTYVTPYNTPTAPNYQFQQRTQIKTPFPIINQNEKKVMDRILDFLMGEGQNSLYGMICKECYAHNGMGSFEDYEYSPFRCAFCKVLNPAKKIRPIAPAIPVENIGSAMLTTGTIAGSSSTSSSDRDSGSDSEQQSIPRNFATNPSPTTDASQHQATMPDMGAESTSNDDEQPSQSPENNLNEETVQEKSDIDKKLD